MSYLSSEVGIAISNKIIAHILWGDDLILFSDTPSGLQKQLDGLLKFCSNNKIIVNEIKIKSMCFGTNENLNMCFNGKPIQQVTQYKYPGVIVRYINKVGHEAEAKIHLVYFWTCSELWYDLFLRMEVMYGVWTRLG